MGLRVLIIEDNPDHAFLTRRALVADGRIEAVEVAGDATTLVEDLAARDPARRPDAILLDLKLPGPSGLEVLAALKDDEATRGIPVMVLSTSARDDEIRAALSRGAQAYFEKPVDVAAFVEALGAG